MPKKKEETPVAETAVLVIETLESQVIAPIRSYDAELSKWKAEYLALTINGVEDKKGYKAVDEARKMVKRTMAELEKIRLSTKKKYVEAIDGEAERLFDILSPIKTYLEGIQDPIDVELDRIKREEKEKAEKRLRDRTEKLIAIDMRFDGFQYSLESEEGPISITLDEVKKFEDEDFDTLYDIALAEYNFKIKKREEEQAEAKRKQDEIEEKNRQTLADLEAKKKEIDDAAALLEKQKADLIETAQAIKKDLLQEEEQPAIYIPRVELPSTAELPTQVITSEEFKLFNKDEVKTPLVAPENLTGNEVRGFSHQSVKHDSFDEVAQARSMGNFSLGGIEPKKIILSIENSLTKENFWNLLMEDCPDSVKAFCDWVDEYKKRVNWDSLFDGGRTDGKDIKFHDLPISLQIGVIVQFSIEKTTTFGTISIGSWDKTIDIILSIKTWFSNVNSEMNTPNL